MWRSDTIMELLRSGSPVHPTNARRALPYAACRGVRLDLRAAAALSAPPSWRLKEAMVGLAFDLQEQREDDERLSAREARVRELQRELAGLGGGGSSSSDDDDEEEEE